jgi:uncharacterized protein involved in exopolysaccharide biosynthesis/Mrp family chromosome partitioning ATPase
MNLGAANAAISGNASPYGGERRMPGESVMQQLLAALYRQRWPLILSLAGALVLGVLAVLLLPKSYTAVATVQLEQQTPQFISASGLDPEPQDTNRFLQTQLDKIESRALAQDVAKSLRIAQSPEILRALGGDFASEEELLRALREGVGSELGLNTRLARLSFTSRDPAVSAQLANAYAEALIAQNLRGKVETSTKAEEYLLERLNEAKLKLEESERQMIEYARRSDLTGAVMKVPDAETQTMPSRQMEQLGTALADATSRRIIAEQEWSQIRNTSPAQLPQVQENRAYQELLAQKAQLQSELADERARRTDAHPQISAKVTKIAELNREISRLSSNIKQSFEQRYRAAASQETQLQSTIDQLRNAALAEEERGVGYKSLEREVETNRIAFDGLLQRFKEVSAAAGAPAANVLLMDRAEPPLEPSSAGPTYTLALALILGMILAMGIALLREFAAGDMRSAQDVEAAVGLHSLGAVPAPDRGMAIKDCLRDHRSPQSEAFKSIATAITELSANSSSLPRSVLITSSIANEGKSTSVLGLARGLAALGHSVIIVNGDLRNPSAGPGLVDVLIGRAEPLALVRRKGRSLIGVLDAGTTTEDVTGLLHPARMRPVIEQLGQVADIVLVDGPPVMGLADAVLLSRSVEAALIVVEANRITPDQLGHTLSRLPETLPMASILTKFDARKAGTSYGSTSHYRYGKSAWGLEAA